MLAFAPLSPDRPSAMSPSGRETVSPKVLKETGDVGANDLRGARASYVGGWPASNEEGAAPRKWTTSVSSD